MIWLDSEMIIRCVFWVDQQKLSNRSTVNLGSVCLAGFRQASLS